MNLSPAVYTRNLCKHFQQVRAVDDLNLSVHPGEMFGLLGPDGAGKTTTLRMLCTVTSPTSGHAEVLGFDTCKQERQVKQRVGYLSQGFSLYGDLSVQENIEFFADIHGVSRYRERMEELLAFTSLAPFKRRLADRLSGGMKKKLALACTLIHTPDIIFLDEPTTGVDPVSRREFWTILADLLSQGLTILLTTPYMDEAERCNRVALMHKGNILLTGTPDALKLQLAAQVLIVSCTPLTQAENWLAAQRPEIDVQRFGKKLHLLLPQGENSDGLIQRLRDAGISVRATRQTTPSMENVFIHVLKQKQRGAA